MSKRNIEIKEIEKKLQKMTKSEIFQICRKMKCPKGTKKEMIGNLLRPLGKKYKMDKIPYELIRDYIGKSGGRQDIGRLATTSKRIRTDLLPELERRRFHAENDTIKGAVKEYLRDKRSAIRKYGDISGWDVSNVTDMRDMFGKSDFNGDLSTWDVSNVTNMDGMFVKSDFNGDLSTWDVSNVRNMGHMFNNAKSFNGDLSKWNVSNVRNMGYMFNDAKSFNGDLSKWDVSNVTDMNNMFNDAKSFNGDLSTWDVSNVTNMGAMFKGAESFNGDLSTWDVSNVTDMRSMFENTPSFDRRNAPWYFDN